MKIKFQNIFIIVTIFILSLIISNQAFAHKVSIFAYSEGGMIYTESYFPDGSPAVNGEIQVYDSNNRLILEGKTNNQGIYDFKVPRVDDLKIILLASMGHRAEFLLKKEDIAGTAGEAQNESKKSTELNQTDDKNNVNSQKSSNNSSLNDLTAEEVRKIVSEEVSKELKPVARGIAKLQEKKPGITEIIGGIGYIIGLVGIAMFFMAKKRD